MEFWSQGLGSKQLVLVLGKAHHEVADGELVLTGTVEAPAEWNYRVRMSKQDLVMVLEMATSPEIASYLAASRGSAPLRSMLLHTIKLVARLTIYSALWFRCARPKS